MVNIKDEFSDVYMAVCACPTQFCEHLIIDPEGRPFCLACKRYTMFQALKESEISSTNPQQLNGFFTYTSANQIIEDLKVLREYYQHLPEADTLGNVFLVEQNDRDA